MKTPPLNNLSFKVYQKAGQIMDWPARKFAKKLETGFTDEARFAASMLVTSIISKDAINCFLYTYQSWNNERIPEQKRKFVAAIDLMNGILMVGGQLIVGKIIDAKFTPIITGKIFTGVAKYKGKTISIIKNASDKVLAKDNVLEVTRNALNNNKDKFIGIDINKVDVDALCGKMSDKFAEGSKFSKSYEKGFGIIVTALATTALVKRTLAPLFSTPLAGWAKEKFLNGNEKPPVEDRVYYQWATSGESKGERKLNKPVFRNFS